MTESTAQASAEKLARIRALLAKAEATEYEGEAEAYFAKAAELMAAYGVDRALLAATAPETDRVGDRVFRVPPPYAFDKVLLLHGVAEALGAKTVLIRIEGAGRALHVFAMESDLERIDMLFASLLVQAARGMATTSLPPGYTDVKVWKRDWMRGFNYTVRQRLREAERYARRQAEAGRTSGPSVELVLVDRKVLVDRRFAGQYPRLRSSSSRRRVGSGYDQGLDAGRRADLGGTRLAGRQTAIGR